MKLILIAMAALLLAAITMVASVSAQTGGGPIFVDDDSDCSTATRLVVPYSGFNITVFQDHPVGGEVWDFDFCEPDGDTVLFALGTISPIWREGERVELPFLIDHDGVMYLAHDQNERGGIDEWEVSVRVVDIKAGGNIGEGIDAIRVIVRFIERPTPTPTSTPTPTATPITTPAPTPVVADPTRTPTPAATASPTPTSTPVSIDDRVSALESEVSTLRALIGALIDVLLGWRQSE